MVGNGADDLVDVQPPSGGCELKRALMPDWMRIVRQPPSGGCELKHPDDNDIRYSRSQPPSGGCELKRTFVRLDFLDDASRLRAAVS